MKKNSKNSQRSSQASNSFFSLDTLFSCQKSIINFWKNLPGRHKKCILLILLILLCFVLIPFPKHLKTDKQPKSVTERVDVSIGVQGEPINDGEKDKPKRVEVSSAAEEAKKEEVIDTSADPKPWHDHTVKVGEKVADILTQQGISEADIRDLFKVEGKNKPLTNIEAGHIVRFRLTNSGKLDILQIKADLETPAETMYFRLSSGGFARTR